MPVRISISSAPANTSLTLKDAEHGAHLLGNHLATLGRLRNRRPRLLTVVFAGFYGHTEIHPREVMKEQTFPRVERIARIPLELLQFGLTDCRFAVGAGFRRPDLVEQVDEIFRLEWDDRQR